MSDNHQLHPPMQPTSEAQEGGIRLTAIYESHSMTRISTHSATSSSSLDLQKSECASNNKDDGCDAPDAKADDPQSCKLRIYKSDPEEKEHDIQPYDDDYRHVISRLVLVNRLLTILIVFGFLVLMIMFGISYSAVAGCGNQSLGERIKAIPRLLFGRYIYPEERYRKNLTEMVTDARGFQLELCSGRYSLEFADTSIKSIAFNDMKPIQILAAIPVLQNVSNAPIFEKVSNSSQRILYVRWPIKPSEWQSSLSQSSQMAAVRFTSTIVCEECETQDSVQAKMTYIFDSEECGISSSSRKLILDEVLEVRTEHDSGARIAFCKDDQYDLIGGLWFSADSDSTFQSQQTIISVEGVRNESFVKMQDTYGMKQIGGINNDNTGTSVSFFTNRNAAKLLRFPLDQSSNFSEAIKLDVFGHTLRECTEVLMEDEPLDDNNVLSDSADILIVHNQYVILN